METCAYDPTASLGRWSIDDVDFDVTAAWGLTLAHGRFDRVAGVYEVGPNGTRIELTVDAGSLVTANGILDDLRHSAEAAGIAENPEVRFTSTRIFDSGEGKLHVDGRIEATGKVVPVEFDAVVHRVGNGLELEATAGTVHVRAHLTAARVLA